MTAHQRKAIGGLAILLFLAGPMTVIPLVLFSWAARRMPLSTLGFLQFLAPTLSFVIGAAEGEALAALNGKTYPLQGGMTVIADASGPAITLVRSRTRIPASGRLMRAPPREPLRAAERGCRLA